jgi:hypothetical protein
MMAAGDAVHAAAGLRVYQLPAFAHGHWAAQAAHHMIEPIDGEKTMNWQEFVAAALVLAAFVIIYTVTP